MMEAHLRPLSPACIKDPAGGVRGEGDKVQSFLQKKIMLGQEFLKDF